MNHRRLRAAALAALLPLAAGCRHAGSAAPLHPPGPTSSTSSAPSPPSSGAAEPPPAPAPPAFAQLLPLLRPAQLPVYLPAWLPPLPAGESYYFTGSSSADGYRVGIAMSKEPAAANSLPDLPMTDQIGSVAGGRPGRLGPSPALTPPADAGQSVDLGGGIRATYHGQAPGGDFSLLQWQEAGWTFQVADVTGLGAPADRLVTYAHRLIADLPPGGRPVPDVPSGTVVQTLAPDGAPAWVVWRQAGWEYRVEAYNAPVIRMARSLVRVAP